VLDDVFARVPHVQTARENWVQVFMQVVLLRARCCWRGRFDVLDFEIQTVADLASMTLRSASPAFGRTDATLPG
jgi:hypothetical protein